MCRIVTNTIRTHTRHSLQSFESRSSFSFLAPPSIMDQHIIRSILSPLINEQNATVDIRVLSNKELQATSHCRARGRSDFVYVLLLHQNPHWICIASIRQRSYYFDSLPVLDSEASALKEGLFHSTSRPVTIVQKKLQTRDQTCGIFALFAAILLLTDRNAVGTFENFLHNSQENDLYIIEFLRQWIRRYTSRN